MRKTFTLIVTAILLSISSQAQDPGFSQFYANPLYLNPAFTGSALCPRINFNYRNQWPALTGTYVTYSASYDQHVRALSGGLGLLVTRDEAGEGTINTTNIAGSYAYQTAITRDLSIRAGFQAAYLQKALDWSKLTFGDMINAQNGFVYNTSETPGSKTVSNVDISAGLLLYGKKIYAGVAAHHLTQPDESFLGSGSKLPTKYTAHAGANIPVGGRGSDTKISPNIIYMQQGDFTHLNLGLYVKKGPIVGGLWYRNQDAMILLLGLEQGMFKVGYSYDITVNKLSNVSAGSHELSCSMVLKCKPKSPKFRKDDCPSF